MQDAASLMAFYRNRRAELDLSDGSHWHLLIKEIRLSEACSIEEAYAIALTDPIWRRWFERQINSDPACWKAALRHMRDSGDRSLIARQDGRLLVR